MIAAFAALALAAAQPAATPAPYNPGDNATSSQSPAYVFQPPAPARPAEADRGQEPKPPPAHRSTPATTTPAGGATAPQDGPPPQDAQRPR